MLRAPLLPPWGQWQELRDGPGILGKTSLSLPQAPQVKYLETIRIHPMIPSCVFMSKPQEDSRPQVTRALTDSDPQAALRGSLPCAHPSAHRAPLPLHSPDCPSAACCTQTRASRGDCGFPSPLPGRGPLPTPSSLLSCLQLELGSPCPSRPLSKCSPPPTQL